MRRRLAAFVPKVEPQDHARVAGDRLEGYLRGTDAVVLHHLRLPGGRRRVNHIVVGPAGVTVVDSSQYGHKGKGKAIYHGGMLRIGKRDRTDLVEHVLEQADAVHDLLADTVYADVPVDAALATRNVEGHPTVRTRDGHRLTIWGTRTIAAEASRKGPLSSRKVEALAAFLAGELG